MKKINLVLIFLISNLIFSQKFMISIEDGPSWRLAKNAGKNKVQKDFIDELKKGNSFRIKGTYLINKNIGIGLQMSQYTLSKQVFGKNNID